MIEAEVVLLSGLTTKADGHTINNMVISVACSSAEMFSFQLQFYP